MPDDSGDESNQWSGLLSTALRTAGTSLQSINAADAAKNNANATKALTKIIPIALIGIGLIVVVALVFKRH